MVAFRIPRWVWTCLTVSASICAAAAGYQSDHRRLRASQDQELSQLSGALNAALLETATLQRQSVRPPRISANSDTLEFTVARALLLAPGVTVHPENLYADSLCLQSVKTFRRSDQAGLGSVPLRLWALDLVRIYVDKDRGGLWRRKSGGEAALVAARVETLAVESDRSGEEGGGFLLELTGSWNIGAASPIRRKLYRYLPSAEMSRG